MDDLLLLWFPTIDEAEAMAHLDRDSYGSRALTATNWGRLIADENSCVVCVGREYKRPLGVVAVTVLDGAEPKTAILHRLAVHTHARNQGIGTFLVHAVGEQHQLNLELRERSDVALAFARSVGFKAVGLSPGRFGDCDGIRLERPADQPAAA